MLDDVTYSNAILGLNRRCDALAMGCTDSLNDTWLIVTEGDQAFEQYRLLAENASDVVIQTSADRVIRWISPSVEQLLGWRVSDLVGKKTTELIYAEDVLTAEVWRDIVFSGQKIEPYELRCITSNNEVRWMGVHLRVVRGESGVIDTVVIGLRDCHAEVIARRALNTLSAGNRILVRAHNEAELLAQMCQVAVDEGGYRFAWYGRRIDDAASSVTKLAMSNDHRSYLDQIDVRWANDSLSQGPAGRSIDLGKSVVLNDLRSERNFAPWLEAAEEHGFRSMIALPVRIGQEIDGALLVYAPEPGAFDGSAVSLLEDLAAQLGYGLERLRDYASLVVSLADGALLNRVIEQSGESIVVCDSSTTIVYVNPATSRISGYTSEELIGATPRIFMSGLMARESYEEMWSTLMNGQMWSGVLVNRRKSGEQYEEDTTISPVYAADGTLVNYVAVKRDLTSERLLQAHLSRDLEDRGAIVEVMRTVRPSDSMFVTATAFCEAATRLAHVDAACVLLSEGSGKLLPIAACGTKIFNIDEGQAFMPNRASRVADVIDGPMTLNMDPAAWRSNPDRLTTVLEEGITGVVLAPVRWQNELVGILAFATKDPADAATMEARFALFEQLGSYASTLFGAQANEHRQREDLRIQVRDIIDEARFHSVFQPFVEINTGITVGYEALTRFDDGRPPDLCFLEAHTVGLGSELEALCASVAIESARDLAQDLFLSVNFSPAALLDGHAATTIARANRPIVIEITEHVRIGNYAAVRKAVDEIEGCQLAVDDAGAGFASLSHILELRPDYVKLDISIVRNIDSNPARQSMTAGMCHFAQKSGTVIIAEGVETQAEADTLRELGVTLGQRGMLAQGYLFGRPKKYV